MSSTLLSQISQLLTVDIDCMDPEVAKRHTTTSAPFFCDMTSNQAIVGGEATRTEQSALLRAAIAEVKEKQDLESDSFAQDVLDLFTVLLAKQVYPYLKGNVHAQTSPPAAFDIQKTVVHAKKLVGLFEANGISRSRVCIKIPTTAEGMVACAQLQKEGIQTLATCLFNVSQALAAHQAKCVYVAPYFNELRVHFEPTIWREFAVPGKEHPMSQVIFDVKAIFGKLGSSTKVMPASIVTPREVIGLVSLKPDHITISGGILDKLATLPPVAPEELVSSLNVTEFSEDVLSADYLAADGALLREALAKDVESTRKLDDALKLFNEAEIKTKEYIINLAKTA
ncbi:aldolase [Lentinula raphanica]|nr:aldolase [Lentinula raphanica]